MRGGREAVPQRFRGICRSRYRESRTHHTVATPSLPPISPLRGLLEVTRLVRTVEHLPVLLDAVARVVSESLGYRTVVINLYRPAWNDFLVTTVHGDPVAQEALLGGVRRIDEWEE